VLGRNLQQYTSDIYRLTSAKERSPTVPSGIVKIDLTQYTIAVQYILIVYTLCYRASRFSSHVIIPCVFNNFDHTNWKMHV